MGFFDKLKQGLAKTGRMLKTDVRDLFKSEGRLIDEAFLDEMRAILFQDRHGLRGGRADRRRGGHELSRPRGHARADVVATWKEKLGELMAQDDCADPLRRERARR